MPGGVVEGTFTLKAVTFVVEPDATVMEVALKAADAPLGKPLTSVGENVTVPLNPVFVVPEIVNGAVVVPAFAVIEAGEAERAKSAATKVAVAAWLIAPLEAVTGTP